MEISLTFLFFILAMICFIIAYVFNELSNQEYGFCTDIEHMFIAFGVILFILFLCFGIFKFGYWIQYTLNLTITIP